MQENSVNNNRLGGLVGQIYDAALGARSWAGLADTIAQTFDATSTVLKTQDAASYVQLMEVTDNLIVAPQNQAWADHWHANDLWVQRSVAFGVSKVITNRDLIVDNEFERLDFYRDWCRSLDIYHMVGVVFPLGNDTMGVLGIHRARTASHFAHKDRCRVAQFFPHLQRALSMRQQLQHAALARATAFDALARLAVGVLVIDRQCRVLYANPLAEKTLRSGADIEVRGGRLHIDDTLLAGRLTRAVREAVRTADGALGESSAAIAIARAGRLPLTLLVAPLRSTAIAEPAALVFLRDPEGVAAAPYILRELFGFTRTEAAIAAALAEGKALDQIALAFSVGIGTVRSHLKAILAKTGTRRQGQLIALIVRSVAALNESDER